MGSNPIVASVSKPPFFTRLGCSFLISVLTLMLAGMIVGGLTAIQFYLSGQMSKADGETFTQVIRWTFILTPGFTVLFAAIAFFESVDFLVWLKNTRQ